MQIIAVASLVTLMASVATAAPATGGTGTFSVVAYSSGSCATTSTLVQTAAGSQAAARLCFSLASPMASFDLVMNGSYNKTVLYTDNACVTPQQTDIGSPWNAGCQTFAAGPLISFKVTF